MPIGFLGHWDPSTLFSKKKQRSSVTGKKAAKKVKHCVCGGGFGFSPGITSKEDLEAIATFIKDMGS